MSFNRLPYDTCSYKHVLSETIGPGVYQLATPPNTCEPCHPTDPYIRLQGTGVSLSKNTALIDIDSELIGITRNSSQCPERKYLPGRNVSAYCGAQTGAVVPGDCQKTAKLCVDNTNVYHWKDCFTPTEDTRLSNPSCNLRGTGWNRWEWLWQNPQDRVEMPFDYQIDSVLLAKDSHRPCVPHPIQQNNSWPVPSNKPYCETIVPVCYVPTEPPSTQWQSSDSIRLY